MRLIDIDDERFWDVLFDKACVEGNQAERIKKELERIIIQESLNPNSEKNQEIELD